jgi:hypothetical protein
LNDQQADKLNFFPFLFDYCCLSNYQPKLKRFAVPAEQVPLQIFELDKHPLFGNAELLIDESADLF